MRVDALVIGAGHNGLVAAAYLARSGLRTRIVERRPLLGGACVTEELWPGYRISRAAYVAGLLRPVVLRELELPRRGLRLLPRDPSSYTPLPDGGGLMLGPDVARSAHSIRRFSERDAERYPAYERLLDRAAVALEPLLDRAPPDLRRLRLGDLGAGLALAGRIVRGLRPFGRESGLGGFLALLTGSARNVLESWFESEPLRATLATDALIGAWAGPSTPGTGYVLFHHVMGRTNGSRGVWAYAAGGMGSLADALAHAARDAGCEIEVETAVAGIAVEGGRARGVELEDGRLVEADVVVSNLDPKRTLLGLVGEQLLPPEFVLALRALDTRSPVVKINLALEQLPRFRGATSDAAGPEHVGTIHLGAMHLDALQASFYAACAGRLPEHPMIEMTIPSVLDPGLAPAGHHVASLFVQHVPWSWSETDWAGAREPFADRVLAEVDAVAPGFSARVLEREVLTPPDLERIFGLTGGNIFHGAMTLDRLWLQRPLPGWAGYRTPVAGLYLCGAGTHPGGGVMGACGRNAARCILRDRRSRR